MAAIKAFTSLRELWISSGAKADPWAALVGASQTIEFLVCRDGGDASFEAIGTLRKLKRLWAGGNDVSDVGIAALAGLPLEELNVVGKKVTDTSLAVLGQMKGLTNLEMTAVTCTDVAMAKLVGGLPKLTGVKFEGCKNLGDATFAAAVRGQSMRSVVWKAKLTQKGIAALASASKSVVAVSVYEKIDAAAFDAVLAYRKAGGRFPISFRELSSKQSQ